MLLVEDRFYGKVACTQINLKSKHLLIHDRIHRN